jgi:hypothetical protein
MNSKTKIILSITLVLCLLGGCAARTSPVINPMVPKTALQWTIVSNAALAKANHSLELSVQSLQGNKAITADQARPLILTCGRLATVSEQVRAITSVGTEATWSIDGPKIRAILSSASINFSPGTAPIIDMGVATVNAALLLLSQEVK